MILDSGACVTPLTFPERQRPLTGLLARGEHHVIPAHDEQSLLIVGIAIACASGFEAPLYGFWNDFLKIMVRENCRCSRVCPQDVLPSQRPPPGVGVRAPDFTIACMQGKISNEGTGGWQFKAGPCPVFAVVEIKRLPQDIYNDWKAKFASVDLSMQELRDLYEKVATRLNKRASRQKNIAQVRAQVARAFLQHAGHTRITVILGVGNWFSWADVTLLPGRTLPADATEAQRLADIEMRTPVAKLFAGDFIGTVPGAIKFKHRLDFARGQKSPNPLVL